MLIWWLLSMGGYRLLLGSSILSLRAQKLRRFANYFTDIYRSVWQPTMAHGFPSEYHQERDSCCSCWSGCHCSSHLLVYIISFYHRAIFDKSPETHYEYPQGSKAEPTVRVQKRPRPSVLLEDRPLLSLHSTTHSACRCSNRCHA